MKKNVAGQKIGAQMIDATDGSAFTGAVTVAVTGDAGTQAAGSVGSAACAHEGNGYHTYAPAQAETNYDLVAFTFIGSGAVPATVQIFTTFPQTGDSFSLIGAAGAGLTALATQASVDTIDNNVDAILVDTAEIGAAGAGLTAINLPDQSMNITGNITGNLSGSVGSVTGAVGSVTGAVGSVAAGGITAASFAANAINAAKLDPDVVTELQAGLATAAALATVDGIVDDILLDTAEIGAAGAGLTALATQASVNDLPTNAELATALGTADDAVLTAIGDLPTNAELATALGTADDAVLAQIALIKTQTDKLTFTVANQLDANVQYVNDVEVAGDGETGTEWGPA